MESSREKLPRVDFGSDYGKLKWRELKRQFDDIVWGKRLGAGSFGSVFKGEWLQCFEQCRS